MKICEDCARDVANRQLTQMGIGGFKPQCDELGNYHKRQCYGSVCNCVNPRGEQIDGFSASIGEAKDMSCG